MSGKKRERSGGHNRTSKRYKQNGSTGKLFGVSGLKFNDLKNGIGFLVTCNKARERQGMQEIGKVLCDLPYTEECQKERERVTMAAESQYSPPAQKTSQSMADQLTQEIAEVQKQNEQKSKLFKMVDMTVTGLFAIQAHGCVDVVKLARELLQKVHSQVSGASLTRICTRFIPIQRFVPATTQDVIDAVLELAKPIFSQNDTAAEGNNPQVESSKSNPGEEENDAKSKTFAIRFTRRNNSVVDKNKVIQEIAGKIGSGWKVDLEKPNYAVIVQVSKSIAGVSVVASYDSVFEFNMKTALASAVASE